MDPVLIQCLLLQARSEMLLLGHVIQMPAVSPHCIATSARHVRNPGLSRSKMEFL